MLRALSFFASFPVVIALMSWTHVFAISFGAYRLGVTIPVWAGLLTLTVTLRVLFLRRHEAQQLHSPTSWFTAYAAMETAAILAVCVDSIADRQPDMFPVIIAMVLTVPLLSLGQLVWAARL